LEAILKQAIFGTLVVISVSVAMAQDKGAAKAPTKPVAAASVGRPATLAQLMKGVLYPASNVIFAAQDTDPAKVPQAKDAGMAINPLESAYGKWEAVENASLALAEASSLITLSGRKCSNGRAVPIANPDWAKLAQNVRTAGLLAFKAAQAKDQDKIVDAAGAITEACANCHDKYREVAVRCK
jgi:hypothetical protein